MRYEIRYFYRQEEDELEITATLDAGMARAKKLSAESSNLGALLVIVGFDSGKRTCRAFAHNGVAFWSKTCVACKGKGGTKHDKCYDCNGYGGVIDRNEVAAA